jgi:hypothetical protein
MHGCAAHENVVAMNINAYLANFDDRRGRGMTTGGATQDCPETREKLLGAVWLSKKIVRPRVQRCHLRGEIGVLGYNQQDAVPSFPKRAAGI